MDDAIDDVIAYERARQEPTSRSDQRSPSKVPAGRRVKRCISATAAFAIAVAGHLSADAARDPRSRCATRFYDLPAGYKGHRQPTPYLGGYPRSSIAGIVDLRRTCRRRNRVDRYLLIVVCAVGVLG